MLSLLLFSLSLGLASAIKAPSECCGYVNRDMRIVGGNDTEKGEYPWQAGIVWVGQTFIFCGGSLINDRYVLSAAHCMASQLPEEIQVLLGAHEVERTEQIPPEGAEFQRFNVSAIIMHEDYNPMTFHFDIALIKLGTVIAFTSNEIATACLAKKGGFKDVDAIVTGWGALSETGGILASTLQEVTVRTMKHKNCKKSYDGLTRAMLCAGVPEGGKDACQGDSGGPLVTEMGDNRYIQIGVVSFGVGCAREGYPGVYARVTEAYEWIMNNTADANLC